MSRNNPNRSTGGDHEEKKVAGARARKIVATVLISFFLALGFPLESPAADDVEEMKKTAPNTQRNDEKLTGKTGQGGKTKRQQGKPTPGKTGQR